MKTLSKTSLKKSFVWYYSYLSSLSSGSLQAFQEALLFCRGALSLFSFNPLGSCSSLTLAVLISGITDF